jgi:hypothetical protein
MNNELKRILKKSVVAELEAGPTILVFAWKD